MRNHPALKNKRHLQPNVLSVKQSFVRYNLKKTITKKRLMGNLNINPYIRATKDILVPRPKYNPRIIVVPIENHNIGNILNQKLLCLKRYKIHR